MVYLVVLLIFFVVLILCRLGDVERAVRAESDRPAPPWMHEGPPDYTNDPHHQWLIEHGRTPGPDATDRELKAFQAALCREELERVRAGYCDAYGRRLNAPPAYFDSDGRPVPAAEVTPLAAPPVDPRPPLPYAQPSRERDPADLRFL